MTAQERAHADAQYGLLTTIAAEAAVSLSTVSKVVHRRRDVAQVAQVAQERRNFDPTGHYSRPDVFTVEVDRRRREASTFRD
nr:hypothetical protein [Streptomyces sp. 846.5]